MYLLGGAKVYQEHVCLSWNFYWIYFLMSTTYRRNFRLVERFRAEIQNFQNDLFSNFVLKFLIYRYIDFAENFFSKAPFYGL